MSNLGLDSASSVQGFAPIPNGTVVELGMKIIPGNTGIEGLCARSSRGDCEGLNVEYVVRSGEHEGRKLHAFHVIAGSTAGHAKARDYTLTLLRAILEAVHGIDPKDISATAKARRASATLGGFDNAVFLAELKIERGGLKPDGVTLWPDKNVIAKVLRIGDVGYRQLDQPAPSTTATVHEFNGSPTTSAVAKPNWS